MNLEIEYLGTTKKKHRNKKKTITTEFYHITTKAM